MGPKKDSASGSSGEKRKKSNAFIRIEARNHRKTLRWTTPPFAAFASLQGKVTIKTLFY